jgi:cytochrome c oxidase subunit 3
MWRRKLAEIHAPAAAAAAHHGHADHAHQFDDKEQQAEAVSLGMWAFLVQEILFFGGLFTGYAVYRSYYPEAFIQGSHHLDILLGGFNTVVLIASSLTMAMAVHSAQTSKRGMLVLFLIATLILGFVFLGVKVIEYSDKYHHHLIPGISFFVEGETARQQQIFFSFYFAMTGMHALHMIIGALILTPLIFMAMGGKFSASYYAPIEVFGLYWHFVDIVWIFLFPLLYLIGRH